MVKMVRSFHCAKGRSLPPDKNPGTDFKASSAVHDPGAAPWSPW